MASVIDDRKHLLALPHWLRFADVAWSPAANQLSQQLLISSSLTDETTVHIGDRKLKGRATQRRPTKLPLTSKKRRFRSPLERHETATGGKIVERKLLLGPTYASTAS